VRRIQISPPNSIRPPKRLYNDSVSDSEDKEMKRVKVQHKNEPDVEAFNGNVKHETKVNRFNMLISPLRNTMASLPDRNRTSCRQKWRRHNSSVITFPGTQPSPPCRPSKPSLDDPEELQVEEAHLDSTRSPAAASSKEKEHEAMSAPNPQAIPKVTRNVCSSFFALIFHLPFIKYRTKHQLPLLTISRT
jgi:hypothetical protein